MFYFTAKKRKKEKEKRFLGKTDQKSEVNPLNKIKSYFNLKAYKLRGPFIQIHEELLNNLLLPKLFFFFLKKISPRINFLCLINIFHLLLDAFNEEDVERNCKNCSKK